MTEKDQTKTKRYFIWRDESGDVHCDVLIPSKKISEHGIQNPLERYIAPVTGAHYFQFGYTCDASNNLALSILYNYFDDDLSGGNSEALKYAVDFEKTFLNTSRAELQNFYIDELEIRLFIETCNKELEQNL